MTNAQSIPTNTQTTEAAQDASWVIKNCVIPRNLSYDIERDLWCRNIRPDGLVQIGITDIGQTANGKIQSVTFPRINERLGKLIPARKTVAILESAKWIGPINFAVDGVLVAVNKDLLDHPLWINLEPYQRGWIVDFLPMEPLNWVFGETARDAYRVRIGHTFQSVAGINEDFWCVHCNDWDDL